MLRHHEGEGCDQARRRGRLAARTDARKPSPVQAPDEAGLVTIPGKLSKDLPIGLQRSILKQAGLERET